VNTNELRERAGRIGRDDSGQIAPYFLAFHAGVADPDDRYSAGARFLSQVFEDWHERATFNDEDRTTEQGRYSIARDCSTIHEGLPEVECWRIFADLALWRDDAVLSWGWDTVPGIVDEVSAGAIVDRLGEAVPSIARKAVEVVAFRLAETLTRDLLTIEGKR
jgi:hypothetical protein